MRVLGKSESVVGNRQGGRAFSIALAGVLAALICVLVILLVQRGMQSLISSGEEETPPGGARPGSELVEVTPDAAVAKVGAGAETSPPSTDDVTVEPGQETTEPEAMEGCVVTGKVSVFETEDPAEGIQVVFRPDRPTTDEGQMSERFKKPEVNEDDHHSESGEDGVYRIEGLLEGDYRVFALRGETDFVDIPPAGGRRIPVAEALSPQTVDIEVSRGGVIFGKVLDLEGEPIAEAKVTAPSEDVFSELFDPDSGFMGFSETQTGEDGSYRIPGLPREKEYYLMVTAEGMAKTGTDSLVFAEEEFEIEVDVVLTVGSSVSGRVVALDGSPVEGVNVRIIPKNSKLSFMEQQGLLGRPTDEAGAFLFEQLSPGTYDVTAVPGGGKAVTREIECDGLEHVTDLVLQLETMPEQAGGLALTGRVVDDLGTELEGISIQLNGFAPTRGPFQSSTTSTAEGSFKFGSVPQGVYNLAVDNPKYASYAKGGVAPGGEPVEIVLERMASIRGIVTSRATGEPIGGAVVRAVHVEDEEAGLTRLMAGQLPGQQPSVESSADGVFVLENVAPGRVHVRARAGGFGPGFSEDFQVEPGVEVANASVALSEGGILRGLVLGPDSLPVADASVRAIEVTGTSWADSLMKMMPTLLSGATAYSAKTDADGVFELVHLPRGTLSITASHPIFAPSTDSEVILGQDEKREGVTLRLRRPAEVRVVARDKSKPLVGFMVQLYGGGPMKMGTTDAEGRFIFSSVAPGDYMVQLMDLQRMLSGQGLGMRQTSVTVTEGQALDVKFSFGTGAKVYGKVDGEVPGPMGMVLIRRPEGPAPEDQDPMDFSAGIRAAKYNVGMGFITPDKTYSIPDVPDGKYIIEIPVMPTDMSKMAEMSKEQMTPSYRETIEVKGGRDLEWDIRIRPRK